MMLLWIVVTWGAIMLPFLALLYAHGEREREQEKGREMA